MFWLFAPLACLFFLLFFLATRQIGPSPQKVEASLLGAVPPPPERLSLRFSSLLLPCGLRFDDQWLL
jgi:hypothetical protein